MLYILQYFLIDKSFAFVKELVIIGVKESGECGGGIKSNILFVYKVIQILISYLCFFFLSLTFKCHCGTQPLHEIHQTLLPQ